MPPTVPLVVSAKGFVSSSDLLLGSSKWQSPARDLAAEYPCVFYLRKPVYRESTVFPNCSLSFLTVCVPWYLQIPGYTVYMDCICTMMRIDTKIHITYGLCVPWYLQMPWYIVYVTGLYVYYGTCRYRVILSLTLDLYIHLYTKSLFNQYCWDVLNWHK